CAQAVYESNIRKLYLDEYLSWAEFCNHECGYGKRHMERTIAKMEVVESLCPTSNLRPQPIKSMQVPEPQQNTVDKCPPHLLKPQVLTTEKPQAPVKAAKTDSPKAQPPTPDCARDATGFRLPNKCMPLW